MKEKKMKILFKQFKDKKHMQRFVVETITDVLFLIVVVFILYLVNVIYG